MVVLKWFASQLEKIYILNNNAFTTVSVKKQAICGCSSSEVWKVQSYMKQKRKESLETNFSQSIGECIEYYSAHL